MNIKITLILLFILSASQIDLYAQCSNFDINYPTDTFSNPGVVLVSVDTNMSGGNYCYFSVNEGCIYQWSTCGFGLWDTQISLWDHTGTISYGFNDDACSTQSLVTWFATFTGTVRVLLSQYSCANNTNANMSLQWREYNCLACGATGVNPSIKASAICEGNADTINFTSDGFCSGVFEYQVLDGGGTLVQPWSTNASYIASPTFATTYTVESRCTDCPTIVATDTFLIEIITAPTISGNLNICAGTSTTLMAAGSIGSIEWWSDQYAGIILDSTGTYTTPVLSTTTTYWAQANVQTSPVRNLLITECGLEGFSTTEPSVDYIEISNMYSASVNTTGWVVAVSDTYHDINDVNPVLWYLPDSLDPCSVVSKTDDSTSPDYWGSNIYWNPDSTFNSWAIVIDDVGNVIDFCAWGWTASDIASFNPTINGFSITLGTEWIGDGCDPNCVTVAGVPYSIQRIGNNDSNTLVDFACQTSTPDVVNSGLSCGFVPVSCRFPVTVNVLPELDFDTIFTNPFCYGYSNGTGGATNITGTGPYSYLWSTGDTTQNITGLSAATYYVTATDANGCSSVNMITLTQPNELSYTDSVHNTSCFGYNDGSIVISTVGGTPPYNFYWSNGDTTHINSNIGAGTYSVTVIDSYGCEMIISDIDILQPDSMVLYATVNDALCYGDSSGNASINVNGGTPPYFYIWYDGYDQNQISNIPPGIYSYTVTDNNGCKIENFITIQQPQDIIITDSIILNPSCMTSEDGTICPKIIFGVPPYSFNWSNNTVNQCITDLYSGAYMLTVVDFNNCIKTKEYLLSGSTESCFEIPNCFSPNGDGVNDKWEIIGIENFSFVEIQVFNRWGDVIYKYKGSGEGYVMNQWDGSYIGIELQISSYIFTIDLNDGNVPFQGLITIIK